MFFVFLDIANNYPYSFSAGNSKMEFMAKGLISLNHEVVVFNSRSGYENKYIEGNHNGLKFILFPKGKLIQYCKNAFHQCRELYKIKKRRDNYVIIASTYSFLLIFDILYCKLVGYKVLFLFHELRSSLRSNKNVFKKIDAWLCDNFACYFATGVLPISHYIERHIKKFGKPSYIIPVLADYTNIIPKDNKFSDTRDYFLYCGNIGFQDIIDFIIESAGNNYSIYLVLYGDSNKIKALKCKVQDKCNVKILCDLSYDTLFRLYSNALALIIPLNPNVLQDQIRFSQKIAEYTSSKRPIVTVNTGEIPYYFKNNENAFIIEEMKVDLLSQKFNYIMNHKEEADRIGLEGYKTGLNYFSTHKVMDNFCVFLNHLK